MTREETERNIHEAVEMFVQGVLMDNQLIPENVTGAEYIATSAQPMITKNLLFANKRFFIRGADASILHTQRGASDTP